MITITVAETLFWFVVPLIVLLWCLTWFWARDWNVDGHGANGLFGGLGFVAAIVTLCAAVVLFVEGIIAVSNGA